MKENVKDPSLFIA